VGITGYMTEQSFVSSDYQLINVKGMTTNLNRKTTVVVVLGVAAVTITVLLLFIFLLELSN